MLKYKSFLLIKRFCYVIICLWGEYNMGYLALYRKYRPDSFEDVVGQEKIIKVISNAIVNNKVSHAYLFSGPRGTGKTTTAKIIAKMVNCEHLIDGKPCNNCDSCLNILNSNDVVEIDAASNNGIEEIREIRDKVNFVPSSCKYKVYIIDEVHMLTTQAFNALLKTLEEPPSHVIFILATTEFYKIPLTISSRCQKFQFTKIDDVAIVDRLKKISEMEEIEIEEDALYEIARLADGGLRDAINLLDQLTAYESGKINISDVFKINGSVSYDELYEVLKFVIDKNNKEIIAFVENIDKNGKNINKFVEEIIIFLKDVLIFKNSNVMSKIGDKNDKIEKISNYLDDSTIFYYIEELNELLSKIKLASYPAILLIVTLLKISSFNSDNNNIGNISQEIIKKEEVVEEENKVKKVEKVVNQEKKVNYNVLIDVDVRINNALATAEKSILNDIKSGWSKISDYLLDDRFNVIAGLLSDVIPVVASVEYIILECKYEATSFRLNELSDEISNLLFEIYHNKYKVVSISVERWNKERNNYVSNLKKGIKYSLKEEKNIANNNENKKNDSPVDKLVELFGEDIIEYR